MMANNPKLKLACKGLIVLGAFASFVLVGLYSFQNKIIYLPTVPIHHTYDNPEGYRSPAERNIEFKNVEITTEDSIKLKGWLLLQPSSFNHNTIVFFHENAGNIGLRLDFFELLYRKLKVNVLSVAYRGYSESESYPTEDGLQKDADAIIDYIMNKENTIDKDKVFIQGRSLGGAVAIYAVQKHQSKYNFKGMIVENTFTSIPAMVDKLFFFSRYFKGLILKNYWQSIERIKEIQDIPIIFVTGDKDEIVPTEMTQELFGASSSLYKDFYVVQGGTHNDTWYVGGKEYVQRLKKFIKDCEEKKNLNQENNMVRQQIKEEGKNDEL